MTVRADYEVFTQNKITRTFTQDRAVHAADSPTVTQPCAISGVLAAAQITGTILRMDSASTGKMVVDVGPGQVYKHYVRNVRTYSSNVEATWAAIDEGDQIYYDLDSDNTMPTDCRLSTSPLSSNGTANPRFGWAVLLTEDDAYPKGTTTASTQLIAVMQSGAGGIV